jgi:hypothetical protein
MVPIQGYGVVFTADLALSILHQGLIPLAPSLTRSFVGCSGFFGAHTQN